MVPSFFFFFFFLLFFPLLGSGFWRSLCERFAKDWYMSFYLPIGHSF